MAASNLVLLSLRQVSESTSLSKATIYRALRAGTFPKPVQITARRIGWRQDAIEAFISGLKG